MSNDRRKNTPNTFHSVGFLFPFPTNHRFLISKARIWRIYCSVFASDYFLAIFKYDGIQNSVSLLRGNQNFIVANRDCCCFENNKLRKNKFNKVEKAALR